MILTCILIWYHRGSASAHECHRRQSSVSLMSLAANKKCPADNNNDSNNNNHNNNDTNDNNNEMNSSNDSVSNSNSSNSIMITINTIIRTMIMIVIVIIVISRGCEDARGLRAQQHWSPRSAFLRRKACDYEPADPSKHIFSVSNTQLLMFLRSWGL